MTDFTKAIDTRAFYPPSVLGCIPFPLPSPSLSSLPLSFPPVPPLPSLTLPYP